MFYKGFITVIYSSVCFISENFGYKSLSNKILMYSTFCTLRFIPICPRSYSFCSEYLSNLSCSFIFSDKHIKNISYNLSIKFINFEFITSSIMYFFISKWWLPSKYIISTQCETQFSFTGSFHDCFSFALSYCRKDA